MQRWLIGIFIGLLGCNSVLAAPPLDIVRTQTMPQKINVGSTGTAEYTITNNIGFNLSAIQLAPLPQGVTQVTGGGLCALHQALAQGGYCTLRIHFSGTAVGQQFNDGSVKVCPDESLSFCSSLLPANTQTTTVIAGPASATLSADKTNFQLISDTTINVTNTSSSVTAEDVTAVVNVIDGIAPAITGDCTTIAPGNSCAFHVALSPSAKNGSLSVKAIGTIKIKGTNTNMLTIGYSTNPTRATNVTFTEPGVQYMTFINYSSSSLTGISPTLTGTNHVDMDGSACTTLAPGATCDIPFTATVDAYGTGVVTFAYTLSDNKHINVLAPPMETGNVTVNNTTVSINSGSDIHTISDTGSFTIKNTGNFTVLTGWTITSLESWLTFPSSTCGDALAVGSECTVNYQADDLHTAAATIQANPATISSDQQGIKAAASSTANFATTAINFIPEEYVSIGVEGDVTKQHLSYRAIRITNLTANTQILTDLTETIDSGLTGLVGVCGTTTGGACPDSYLSTCADNLSLGVGDSCYLWFQAQSNPTLQSVSANVSVHVKANDNPITQAFIFNYVNSLYAGGDFTDRGSASNGSPSAPPLPYIVQINGSALGNLGAGMNNSVYCFALFNGDLYAGGNFTTAGSYSAAHVARWNGNDWSAVGSGLDNNVLTLADFNNKLYAGGVFTGYVQRLDDDWTIVGGGTSDVVNTLLPTDGLLYAGGNFLNAGVKSAPHIAIWNDSAWDSLPGGTGVSGGNVYAFANLSSNLYAGGAFESAGASITNTRGIAKWDGADWSALSGLSLGQSVHALAADSLNSNLYAGGTFDSGFSTTGANNIAMWNGANWSPLSTGLGTTGDEVDAIALENVSGSTTVYAGGVFTTAGGGLVVNNFAKWSSGNWSSLNLDSSNPNGAAKVGFNNRVRALIIAPSLTINSKS